ncbi:MAG: septation regulator SpoVG [Firmicutes bacterium]|nr:septation regulator SpoVG [Bacillota bacterium]
MDITDIRVRKINSEGRMKAVVSVTFDNCFVVHDIKVIEGQEKLFVAMPSRKTPDGEFKDIAHPINSEMREVLQSAIISKYEEVKDFEDSKETEADTASSPEE